MSERVKPPRSRLRGVANARLSGAGVALGTLVLASPASVAAREPIFRGGFTPSSFHQFYRGMSNASQWVSVESAEVLLGLGSALVALVGLLLLSMERRRDGDPAAAAEPASTSPAVDGDDPLEVRRRRRAEARRRRNARAAAETSSRVKL